MELRDYPQPYKELYALHQRFRHLGFSPDEILVSVSDVLNLPGKPNILCSHLHAQGLQFTYTVASMGEDAVRAEVLEKWAAFVTKANESSLEELHAVLKGTVLMSSQEMFANLVLVLMQKGFDPPALRKYRHG